MMFIEILSKPTEFFPLDLFIILRISSFLGKGKEKLFLTLGMTDSRISIGVAVDKVSYPLLI